MADDLEQQPFGTPLEQIRDAAPEGARADIGEAVTHIQNHLQQAAIADANTAAADNLENDWHRFGGGMIQWVQNDPTAVHAALDAVDPVARGFISGIPGGIEGDPAEHHAALVGDLQRQIAIAATKSTAEKHAGLTAQMLGDPRIQSLIDPATQRQLVSYASAMADARVRDADGQAVEAQRTAERQSQQSVLAHANALIDNDTGLPTLPDGWHQGVMTDQTVGFPQKGLLGDLYYTVRNGRDPRETDGLAATQLIQRIADQSQDNPSVEEVLKHTVDGQLRFQDALSLAFLAHGQSDQARDHATGLSNLALQGRSVIMGRDGENGVAGQRAFDRYMTWLLPSYRRTGVAGADPENDAYLVPNGFAQFMPTGNDIPVRTVAERRSLPEIFSATGRPNYAINKFGGSGVFKSNEDILIPGKDVNLKFESETPAAGGKGGQDTVIHEPNSFSDTLENYIDAGAESRFNNAPKDM